MAQSLNTVAEYVCPGISYMGLNNYGKIMVGDKAFEFYNDRDVNDFIQIPWEEMTYIIADVRFKRYIPRFTIETKENGTYRFSASKRNRELLRACREHFPPEKMIRATSATTNFYNGLKKLFNKARKG